MRKKNTAPDDKTTLVLKNKTLKEMDGIRLAPEETNEAVLIRMILFYKKWQPKVQKLLERKKMEAR